MKIVSIVGKTNSGKTTLIEKIIPEFTKRGYRIGTIKHDLHQFEIDCEGKDTWRMTKAGADTVVIASDKKIAMIKNIALEPRTCSGDNPQQVEESSIDEISQWLLQDVDIIITEGYKRQDKPKIEVTRTGELLCTKDDNLIAIIDNTGRNAAFHLPDDLKEIPVFKLDEAKKIVDLIKNKYLKGGDE